jgi:hypothetical protein
MKSGKSSSGGSWGPRFAVGKQKTGPVEKTSSIEKQATCHAFDRLREASQRFLSGKKGQPESKNFRFSALCRRLP